MHKHKSPSKRVFKYGIAAYPLEWKEYLVSPQKICLQFKEVQCKARSLGEDTVDMKKTLWGTHEMPIDTVGTSIDTLAVGIPLRLYPEVLKNILKAISEHSIKYPENCIKQEVQEILNDFPS